MPAAAAKANPQAELAKIFAAAETKFGKGIIHPGDESVPVYKLPFRAPNMNYATEGGIGFGRLASLYGDPATGKTRNAYELIAQLQGLPGTAEVLLLPRIAYHTALSDDTKLDDFYRRYHEARVFWLQEELEWIRNMFPNGGEAVFYNAEQQFDPKYAERIGIDTKRLVIVDSTVIEEICEMMQNLFAHYCMHVVDSTSYASSNLQLKEDVGKSLYAVDARQWKASLKPAMTYFDRTTNIAVLVHQMSTNMRTGGQDPNSTKFMRFASSMSIRFERGKFLWLKDGVLVEDKIEGADKQSMAGRAEPDGVEVFAKVEKSRTCRPFRIAGMQFKYKGEVGYVQVHDLAQAAVYYDMIIKGGAGWYTLTDGKKAQGLKAVYAFLADHEDVRDQIMCRLLDYSHET